MKNNPRLAQLFDLYRQYSNIESNELSTVPNLSFYQRKSVSDIEAVIYEPVMCLILQGSKITSIGHQTAELHVGDALVVSHDLPVISKITKASESEPYIALLLSLDLGLTRSLYDQVSDAPLLNMPTGSLAVARADPCWLEPLERYAELMINPLDAKVLGPSILREIHYRLLLSPIGRMLRNLIVYDSHASRISKVTHKIRSEFRSPMSVTELAKLAGMSVASFHQHFREITGITPLQYQKDLRLIHARSLLAEQNQSVSETAYHVGYESPTHFSRDYRRKFGRSPSQELSIGTSPSAMHAEV